MRKIILDPAVVFGAEDMDGFRPVENRFELARDELRDDPGWARRFQVRGGRDITGLPKDCPKKGTIIIVFDSEGRIDRYEVVGPDIVRCHYKRDYTDEYSYSLSRRMGNTAVGRIEEWVRPEGIGSARSLSGTRIVRMSIVLAA